MLRILKRFCWVWLVFGSAQWASAFSLGGPINEAYQVPAIAYNLPGDIMAPKNLGEEYRRNTPVMYYTFDANFLEFFGSNGVFAVEQAFAIMNSLSNVSAYTQGLYEFPYEAQEFNWLAQALLLWDLKSKTLTLLVEQMGLAEPDRYTWTLHDRYLPPGGACPQDMLYLVIKRNFDPVWSTTDQLQPSSYVNGTLYSYDIFEICTGPDPLAEAVEFPVDPNAGIFTAVSAFGQEFGGFYTGLTRDDVGGLRYLLRTNNMNIESAGADTFTFVTNNAATELVVSSNFTFLSSAALTNDAIALTALIPELVISSSTNYFTNIVTTNVLAYFTNFPWSPAGSPLTLVFATNYTTNVATHYNHTFANVITNTYYTTGTVTILETNIGPCGPWSPPDLVCTNVTLRNVRVPQISGAYFLVPTNNDTCGFSILYTQLVSVVATTNLVVQSTNLPTVTNALGQEFSQSIVEYFTNYSVVARRVFCPTNSVALRQGVEKINFVRRDFDSLLNRFFEPVTNNYTLVAVTNNALLPQRIQRVVTGPDFLLTAQDVTAGPSAPPAVGDIARGISFTTNGLAAYPGLAGPGTIETPTTFIYNKVGPVYLNPSTFFLNPVVPFGEDQHGQVLVWGTFDGSTNAPIVYPNGTDITNLENQVFIQIMPTGPDLPDGALGVNYTNVFSGFSVAGGQPPYTWSLAPGSPGLPPLLTLLPNGRITGVPTMAGTFDFAVRMTDAGSRYVDRAYTITINVSP